MDIWSIIGGFVAGGLGSLFAPWANWGVEKKRIKLEGRRKFIEEVRSFVQSDEFNFQTFPQSDLFLRLEPHLSSTTIERFNSKAIALVVGNRGTYMPYKKHILEDLANLEKEWGLI